ncbi:MAG: amylo-alpha-1,6-glucosidase [Thermoplasmata archaeon]
MSVPAGSWSVLPLLTSRSSAVLGDGRGDFTLLRECRGAVWDWGGVTAEMVRLAGPWTVTVVGPDGSAVALGDAFVGGAPAPGGWSTRHRIGPLSVEQFVAPTDRPAGAVRRIRVRTEGNGPTTFRIETELIPHLLPVLVEGIRPRGFEITTAGEAIRIRQGGYGLTLRSDPLPCHLYRDRASWRGGRYAGPVATFGVDYDLRTVPGEGLEVTLLLTGGRERRAPTEEEGAGRWLADPESLAAEAGREEEAWRSETPVLEVPDAPWLAAAYRSARDGLRRLYAEPEPGMAGLVAGYPWYASFWCRDIAWMLPAVLWLGDFDWAERTIRTVLRFQAPGPMPILGGGAGEIPMQVSPGPLLLYGTSDTTLYYPALVERFLRHTGRTGPVREWADAVRRILAWGEARSDPGTGLVRNGGEAQDVGRTAESLASVRCGIDAVDTTIWDSTDRRDHAIDVQVLWHDALVSAVRLADPADPRRAHWSSLAATVRRSVTGLYPWPEEGYLADSRTRDGPVHRVRPNALRTVAAGWFGGEAGRQIVARAARPDLSAPWGVRTLSSEDPSYRPDAYHDGQVWTIATAWAAEAAYAVGEDDRGLAWLRTIAERYAADNGGANECYRGDAPVPYDSCLLLGLSLGPFLTVVFERLWGLLPEDGGRRLRIDPAFPPEWSSARIRGLRLAGGTVAIDWTPSETTVRWTGPGPLRVAHRGVERAIAPGATARWTRPGPDNPGGSGPPSA